MAPISPHGGPPRLGLFVGGSLYGAMLATAGLEIAYLALETPLVSVLTANRLIGSSRASLGLGILWLSLIAGGALLLAGANQLATALARARVDRPIVRPGARALATLADDVAVLADVVPMDGRAVPEVAIGRFGAVVFHALPAGLRCRQIGALWEHRTRDGWMPMDSPLDQAARDADRVRRWFAVADLEFVVHVYAALIVTDSSIARSATCAVVTPGQLPAWIGGLPSQRSLTPARRLRLRTLVTARAGISDDAAGYRR